MFHQRSKKGFTLLELIIVIIILGVLASVGLPKLFENIESSRVSVAVSGLSAIRQELERCHLKNNGNYNGGKCALGEVLNNIGGLDNDLWNYSIPIADRGNFNVLADRRDTKGGETTWNVSMNQLGVITGTHPGVEDNQ